MKKPPEKIGRGKPPASFATDFRNGAEEIQLVVFESVLRSSLTFPLQEPPLGLRRETWPEKARKWMQPMIDAAHAASVEAVRSAIFSLGPLSPMMAHYAAAARAQQARSASSKRASNKGGRPSTILWRREARAIWGKNSLLTASDMLNKLEGRGIIRRDAGFVVFCDEHGLMSDERRDERKFLNGLNTLKNQFLAEKTNKTAGCL